MPFRCGGGWGPRCGNHAGDDVRIVGEERVGRCRICTMPQMAVHSAHPEVCGEGRHTVAEAVATRRLPAYNAPAHPVRARDGTACG